MGTGRQKGKMTLWGAAGETFEGLWGQRGLCGRSTGGSLEPGVRSEQTLK